MGCTMLHGQEGSEGIRSSTGTRCVVPLPSHWVYQCPAGRHEQQETEVNHGHRHGFSRWGRATGEHVTIDIILHCNGTNQLVLYCIIWCEKLLFILGELSAESDGIHWYWRHVSHSQCHKQHGEGLGSTTCWWKHHSITKTSYFSRWIWKMQCLEVSTNIFHGDSASFDLVIIITIIFPLMLCVVCQHPTTLKVHGWQLEYALKNNTSLLRN